MAPSDEENKRQKAQDDANPFVWFRRFADDQMSTLMNGIFSIPSIFGSSPTPPRRSVQDYEKWLQEARESSQPLAREAEESGSIMEVHTRAQKQAQIDARDPISDRDIDPLRCPYRPDQKEIAWPDNPCFDICHMDEATRSRLLLFALKLPAPENILAFSQLAGPVRSVPVAYLLYSPYSPVWLEQHPRLCDHGAKWRAAFQDLLAIQNGLELPPKCSQSTHESSSDWVRGIVFSAICKREGNIEESSPVVGKTSENMKHDPGLLARFTGPRQPEDDVDEDEDADNDDLTEDDDDDDDDEDEVAELDMYDRIFGSQQSSFNGVAWAAAQSFAHLRSESSPSDVKDGNPSILSTLTTTERTTLQDGSVNTKVVLKKRFSDGREESTETVHQQNAFCQKQDAAPKTMKDESARETGKDKGSKESKSSGWFWS